ncbi:MAG: alkyl sulfatase dimerization domain-containing protein, partial [Herbaspirillum sp.]
MTSHDRSTNGYSHSLLGPIVLVAVAFSLVACFRPGTNTVAASADASSSVMTANAAVAKTYDLSDQVAFDDAKRGFIAAPKGQVKNAAGDVLWDFDSFNFVNGVAPPTVNPSLWRQEKLNNNVGLFKVTDHIYQLRGFDLANITLIEGKTGWIVVDTLTSRETSAYAMAFARQHLGNKPVSALIFTHSHVDHFGGALGVLSAEEASSRHVPVIAPIGFMEEATSENVMMGPAMARRGQYMYGMTLPRNSKGLVGEGLGKAVAVGRVGILPPTELIDHTPQDMTIDGLHFVFQNIPGSEAPAELTFYIPEMKAFGGAEMLSQNMHNLYTLRGAKVRDALKWTNYMDQALVDTKDAEVYFGQHHWPVWGHQRIADFIIQQRDTYRYIHDQTVRMMNAGMTADAIAEAIHLPKSLDKFLNVHGYYGTIKHNSRAVYQYYLGWFDANPADLDPLPAAEAARHYVELFGGADKALQSAKKSYDAGDFRWAAEVLKQVVYADSKNTKARELQARCFDQLGYMAESGPWRNFYLTGAQELRQGPAPRTVSPAALLDMLQYTPVPRFLESMAASLNGPKADDVHLKIN